MRKGIFITFEGGEGCGKSSHIKTLAEFFENAGRECVITREPGGTPLAESVREIIKNLAAREYISVKYEDEFEVCLKPLAKGRFAFERALDEEVEKERDAKRYFLWSFLGAAAGGGFIAFVTLIVALISGASC